ncbi:hypothetical protein PLEOSDRAFT_1097984 [Pleurotus ostreatus PC15]|uniref:FAD-binding domain-containing protein n=1 Tax=Pleurotus ostreatus (strain PC15) TaxID=1137138 RepID=A0A067NA79_PLEO1|nr:hypothetical protein PLEOSDRAFT_1097984 [Pleurotus ostreatus PC15]
MASSSRVQLRVVIVGCGIGGLAAAYCLGRAGHHVTVVEAASALREVGAGIQLTPNVSRLLVRWGLLPLLERVAVKPTTLAFCSYNSGEQVGFAVFGGKMEREHGAPYYHIHRADLHEMLYAAAKPYMDLHLGQRVVALDASSASPAVLLSSGAALVADLVIGADGIKSCIRDFVAPTVGPPIPTGDAAYRFIVSVEDMQRDPDLRTLVDTPKVHCWMGPDRHVVAYCVRSQKEYNVVMIHPDNGSVESWTKEGDVEDMKKDFGNWEIRIQKLMTLAKSTLNGKVTAHAPLDTWVDPSGRVVLLGDAAHPMLPYRAQGAAMAIEDAAVLGNLFSRISCKSEIGALSRAYQSIRHPRTTATQQATLRNRDTFHFHDGPAQRARDASMKVAMAEALKEYEGEIARMGEQEGNANMWADKRKNDEQFGYDADEAVDSWWRENWDNNVRANL